jgi:hypothetical protein
MPRHLLTFLDLGRVGMTERELRAGGAKDTEHRITDLPWPIPEACVERLRFLLEPHGFDMSKPIEVQEEVDASRFTFTQ